MADTFVNAQKPIKQGESYYYPLTTAKQVIMSNGQRLNAACIYLDNSEEFDEGTASGFDADTLGGVLASDYALKSDLNTLKQEVSADYALKSEVPDSYVSSLNSKTGDLILTAEDVGASVVNFFTLSFPAGGWSVQTDGSYTQQVEVEGLLETNYGHVDVDMSLATANTFEDLQSAWALIGRAQSVDGGLLLTSFRGSPKIDLAVKLEVIR